MSFGGDWRKMNANGALARKSWLSGLVWKQARTTLAVALLVSVVSSAVELASDLQSERENLHVTTEEILSLVNGSASEAAFQMDRELAGALVKGLFQYRAVRAASLQDNFGNVMAQQERPRTDSAMGWLADRLFAGDTEFKLPLSHRAADGRDEAIGEVSISLDAVTVANGYLHRAGISVVATLARVVAVCALIILAFYLMITKPLLRLTSGIKTVDPAHPGHAPLEEPAGHQGDELGTLVGTANSLLSAFQDGLDARDKAEAELTDLARTLEQRVEDRTLELAREKEGVERALSQLNEAHAELNKVNRHINESIRYASRIQTSLLPVSGSLDGLVHDLAVGWSPRDVVGGDFYWIGSFDHRLVMAVMDCTGHGVPGAFMTAIVASVLDRILHEHCHDDPARILQLLNRLVKSSLRQDQHDPSGHAAGSDDGLDAAICLVDLQAASLTFAGANIPLLFTKAGAIQEIKGDRHSLGYRTSQADYAFTNHVMTLEPGQSFYLTTDGVTDQVGGPKRRLFGRRRLVTVLEEGQGKPMTEQMSRLFTILADYRGEESLRDDVTFIGFTPLA